MRAEMETLAEEVEEGGSIRLMGRKRSSRWGNEEGDEPCHLQPMAEHIETIARRIREGKGYGRVNEHGREEDGARKRLSGRLNSRRRKRERKSQGTRWAGARKEDGRGDGS